MTLSTSTRLDSSADATVVVPGGSTQMGNDRFYPEERPVCVVTVPDLRWDQHPVTNAEFAEFAEATGHLTIPELPLDAVDFPGADPTLLVSGSQVFTPTPGPVQLDDWTQWWRWQPAAAWYAPEGPGSSWASIPDHPVVHIGWEDAAAYARWAGKRLPTEAEWEYAARGGAVGADYAWGDELTPEGQVLANTWQGPFPWRSTDPRGHHSTSPVGSYPANPYGLVDMIGNVWEWTATPWTPDHRNRAAEATGSGANHPPSACCGGPVLATPSQETDRMTTKGGSHVCSPDYCRRYRPAARQGHGIRDTTSHLGFRCVTAA